MLRITYHPGTWTYTRRDTAAAVQSAYQQLYVCMYRDNVRVDKYVLPRLSSSKLTMSHSISDSITKLPHLYVHSLQHVIHPAPLRRGFAVSCVYIKPPISRQLFFSRLLQLHYRPSRCSPVLSKNRRQPRPTNKFGLPQGPLRRAGQKRE